MNLKLPNKIRKIIKGLNYQIDNIGRSEDKVITYENKYVLKVSKNINVLKREYDINKFLEGKIPCAKNIIFIIEDSYAYYLRTYLDGYSLIDNKYLNNPDLLIEALVKITEVLRSLDKYVCNIKSLESTGNAFIHGDLCLPNIYFDKENNFTGFIDLGGSGLGDPWYDYAWMLWSLEYNLKTNKYNQILLDRLNIRFDKEKYNKYIPIENIDMLKNDI